MGEFPFDNVLGGSNLNPFELLIASGGAFKVGRFGTGDNTGFDLYPGSGASRARQDSCNSVIKGCSRDSPFRSRPGG